MDQEFRDEVIQSERNNSEMRAKIDRSEFEAQRKNHVMLALEAKVATYQAKEEGNESNAKVVMEFLEQMARQ